MKNSIIALFLLLSINSYSQIIFEKGYIINNSGEKKTCLIKNVDWKNNPTQIKYKLSENGDVKVATIADIQEFGIDNVSKYKRFIVDIDRSSEIIAKITKEREPLFHQETLFLKVMIEGDASLYKYNDTSLRRFFFNVDNQSIEQLVYKSYMTLDNNRRVNEYYKQQLLLSLKCKDISLKNIKNLDYRKQDLIKVFTLYNQCKNNDYVIYQNKKKYDFFNLFIRAGVKSSSLSTHNNLSSSRDMVFDNQLSFHPGIGVEYILPYNKNKWGVVVEASYQSYKTNKTIDVENVSGGKLVSKVDYQSIEFPIGIRYYFFLNDQSKLFINASYILDYSFNSILVFERADGSTLDELSIKSKSNLAFSAGYAYKKFSLELKVQNPRNILDNYKSWSSKYNTASIYLSYNIL